MRPTTKSTSQILNLQTRVRFPVALPTFLKLFIPKRIRVPSSAWDYRGDYFSRILEIAAALCIGLGGASSVANKTVKIYERVKVQGKWTDRSFKIPRLKADGRMYLKDDREGKFRISWYEGKSKKWHPTICTNLSDVLRVKADKEWFVLSQSRPGVKDPTLPDTRSPISVWINSYIDALTGAKATKKAHRHDLREFEAWNESLETKKGKKFVEEIDKAHMKHFFEYLVDDEPENCPFTAAWKLMRLNKFIRSVLKLDPGKGPIKKSDYRRELKSGQTPHLPWERRKAQCVQSGATES